MATELTAAVFKSGNSQAVRGENLVLIPSTLERPVDRVPEPLPEWGER